MKKLLLFLAIAFSAVLISQCNPAKKAAASVPKITYTNDIQPVVATQCAPCHIPEKGGRIKALNTYDAVKGEADEIIRRIQLHPGEKGFMPAKKTRLSDSTINTIKQWKEGGFAQ